MSILENGLTLKQDKFKEVYLATGNGTEAARQTYQAKSENALAVIASQNLRKPKIVSAIKERLKHIATADEVLGETSEIALAKWKEFVTVEMDDQGNQIKVQLKLNDKLKALEMLAKHHRLLGNNDVTINVTTEAVTASAVQLLLAQGYNRDEALQALERAGNAVEGEIVPGAE